MIIKADTARCLLNIHLLFCSLTETIVWDDYVHSLKKTFCYLPIRAGHMTQSHPMRNKWKSTFILQALQEVKWRQNTKAVLASCFKV